MIVSNSSSVLWGRRGGSETPWRSDTWLISSTGNPAQGTVLSSHLCEEAFSLGAFKNRTHSQQLEKTVEAFLVQENSEDDLAQHVGH